MNNRPRLVLGLVLLIGAPLWLAACSSAKTTDRSTAATTTDPATVDPTRQPGVTPNTVPANANTPGAAPPAQFTVHHTKVGQTFVIDVPKTPGWTEPRSSDPQLLQSTDLSGDNDWSLVFTAVKPGHAVVTSTAIPCYGQHVTVCTGASARMLQYAVVDIEK